MKLTDKGSTQRSFTKDGYLVVPASLSRLGVFDYLNAEVGKQGTGYVKVARTEKSLFDNATIQSFENAPITLGHPTEDVTAKNWKQLAVGSMRNVKRDGDCLVGEAWINDENAIKLVQEQGIEELSCGYSCDLLDGTQAGAEFEMSPMIGNHIAIVANGRCGNVCKLADQQKEKPMSTTRKFLDAFLGAFGIKLTDEQAKKVEEEEEKEPKGEEEKGVKPEPKPEGKKEPKPDDEPEKDKEKKMADADLQAKITALEAENKQLKDAQAANDAANAVATTLADAKANFSTVQFADGATVRQIHEQAVISTGIFAKDELAKLSDAELAGAYQTAKAAAKKLADKQLGGVLLQDANPTATATAFDFNKSYNS